MHSFLLTDSSTLLVGGLQNHILEIDLNTVQETQKVQAWGTKKPKQSLSLLWQGQWIIPGLGTYLRCVCDLSVLLVCRKNHFY